MVFVFSRLSIISMLYLCISKFSNGFVYIYIFVFNIILIILFIFILITIFLSISFCFEQYLLMSSFLEETESFLLVVFINTIFLLFFTNFV